MGKLLIHCDECGSDWFVYHRDNWKDWKARTCPVCGESIDPGTWERSVLKAFGEMEDANIELEKDFTQSDGSYFRVSYIPDAVVRHKRNTEEMDLLREEIEELRSLVTGYLEGFLLSEGVNDIV